MGNVTADQGVLADYRLFLLSLEEEYPGIREEMCSLAFHDPHMTQLLSDLNTEYQKFCSARTHEDIIEIQLAAANALAILKQLFDKGVLPYFTTKASRMAGVQESGFTFSRR